MISRTKPLLEQTVCEAPQSCFTSSTPCRIDAGIVSRSRTNSAWLSFCAR